MHLNNDNGAEPLDRYFSVLKNELPAKFRVCKKVPADFDLKCDLRDLWSIHDEKMESERELIEKIDEGDINIGETGNPSKSLLDLKAEIAKKIIKDCHFCEHNCRIDRTEGKTGYCGVGKEAKVASKFIHRGEETELVPSYTIFFSGCTFECQYCQNWDISQSPTSGIKMSPKEICSSIENMREKGIRNVNWSEEIRLQTSTISWLLWRIVPRTSPASGTQTCFYLRRA